MIYCFDMDGTICTQVADQKYYKAEPIQPMVDAINRLYDAGHTIKVHTARGMASGKDFSITTRKQLIEFGVKFDSLTMGKPAADLYIDDKGLSIEDFLHDQ